MGDYAIGQSVPRFEDLRLVRGGGRYFKNDISGIKAMNRFVARHA